MQRYLLFRMIRNKNRFLLQTVLITAVSLLFLLFQHSIQLKENKKQMTYEIIPVNAFIESEQNMLADKKIPFQAGDFIESTGFVKNSYYEMKLDLYIIEPISFVTRTGDVTNSFYATSSLSKLDPVNTGYLKIVWLEGMNEEKFHSGEQYAILPKKLYDDFIRRMTDNTFYAAGGLRITDNYDFLEEQVWFPFTVAGYFIENEDPMGRKYEFQKNDIIIPLPMAREELLNFGFSYSDSDLLDKYGNYIKADYELKDTKNLNKFRQLLRNSDFSKPFHELEDKRMEGLTLVIEDSLLRQTIQPLDASIRFMRYLTPIFLVIGALTGFFLSILGFSQIKKEYAIMRSLGTGKKLSFALFLEENLMICAIGTALTFLIRSLLKMMETTNIVWLFLFAGFYILGSIVSLIILSKTEPLRILTTNE